MIVTVNKIKKYYSIKELDIGDVVYLKDLGNQYLYKIGTMNNQKCLVHLNDNYIDYDHTVRSDDCWVKVKIKEIIIEEGE